MRSIFFFILILNACEVLSQTSWEIYSTIYEVEEIGFNDDMVYVCHRGGFAIIDQITGQEIIYNTGNSSCLLYTSPSPRDGLLSRMPSSA